MPANTANDQESGMFFAEYFQFSKDVNYGS